MIKKKLCILLVILLCVAITACKTTEEVPLETKEEIPTDTSNQTEPKQDAACVISISINPELELYVKEDLIVTEVVFKNSDAEAAYADIELTNRPLIDSLFVVLDVAHEKGYVQTGSAMDISIVSNLDAQFVTMLKDEVWMVIADFQERKQVEVVVNGSVTTADGSSIPWDGGTSIEVDESAFKSVMRDASGKVIKTVEEDAEGRDIITEYQYDASGQILSQRITLYNEQGDLVTFLMDSEGNVSEVETEENFHDESFKEVERDANGNVIKTVQENAEGRDITVLYTYDENNRLLTEIISQYDSLGNPSNCEKTYAYDENGEVISSVSVYSSGTIVETTYQNGQRQTEKSYNPENGYIQTCTYENGILVSDITEMPDGKYEKWYYDESGKLVERYGFTQSGRAIHSLYNPDGSYTSYITEEDGTTTEEYVDANGNVTRK